MFRKTILPLWLLLALLPILCFGADSTANVQPLEPLENQVEIEGNAIETMLDKKTQGQVMFYGALVLIGYMFYKIIKTK
jgi:hypothetical protein